MFRKSTHTDRYLDFMSHHSLTDKPALVRLCMGGPEQSTRAQRLRTRKPDTSDSLSSMMGLLEGCCSRMRLEAYRRAVSRSSGHPPYVRGLSEAVQRVHTPLGLRVSFCLNITLRQLLVRPKDRVPTEEMLGVVYLIRCAGCLGTYADQTSQCLGKQMKKYHKDMECGDFENLPLPHRLGQAKVRVLEQQPHIHHRLTLKSTHIRSYPQTLTGIMAQCPSL